MSLPPPGFTLRHGRQFALVVLVSQLAFVVLLCLFGKFASSALPQDAGQSEDGGRHVDRQYPLFQDVHVMIFVGFGFLMTFLRRYGFSALTVNLLLACVAIELSFVTRGFVSEEFRSSGRFTIALNDLLYADFTAAVVLITMGAVLGKLTPTQYVIMTLFEVPAAVLTEHIVVHYIKINDVGGSIVVHAFGAVFGLFLSKAIVKKDLDGHQHNGTTYASDIFSMIGTLFLWVFWPSFNAAMAEPVDARERAMLNTLLSLVGSTVGTLLFSQLFSDERRFNMTHVANSTLAGGVAVGTVANVVLHPAHAFAIGFLASFISVLGYQRLTPKLDAAGFHDTCGVNNLHGMPGILAGLISTVLVFCYAPESYKSSLNAIYPGVASSSNSEGWSLAEQAARQAGGLLAAILVAAVTGLVTGLIVRAPIWVQARREEFFSDADFFETTADFEFTTAVLGRIDNIEITEHTPLKKAEEGTSNAH